jgi:hypothetical protein
MDIIRSICANLHGIMRSYDAKNDENKNNLFKQQLLMHQD